MSGGLAILRHATRTSVRDETGSRAGKNKRTAVEPIREMGKGEEEPTTPIRGARGAADVTITNAVPLTKQTYRRTRIPRICIAG